MSDPHPPSPHPEESTPKARASLLDVAGAVFWSFFGVRKGRHMQRDMAIKPLHVVIVGLLCGLVFVLALVALVSFITRGTP